MHQNYITMLIGLVKWFDPEKGFGIVGNPEEGEFFLHINNFINRPQSISKGTAIVFKKKIDLKKNRSSAENCRLIEELEDWKTILNYLDKPDSIGIEVEVTGRGRRGGSYHYKETKSYSLKDLSAKQLFRGKSESEISSMITGYFDDNLNKTLFINYCEFIENRITKNIESEKATTLLADIYSHFGNNLNEDILFHTWKTKKFKFISYTDADEYEIPEKVLKTFSSEIGVPELKRIIGYEFGSAFCNDFINSKFKGVANLTADEIKNLYQFLEFTTEEEREKQKNHLDKLYSEKITSEILEQANKLESIKSNDDFNKYNRLKQLVSNQSSEEDKAKINDALNEIISAKCSEEFKPELWIKGIIEDAPFEFISKTFHDKETQNEKRTTILSKLKSIQQLELLKVYSENSNWEKTFDVLENLVKKENSLGYSFELSEKLFDTEFWKEKKGYDLVCSFIQYANEKTTNEEKYQLFFKGLIKDVPLKIVKQNIKDLGEDECEKIFESQTENQIFIFEILETKISKENISDLDWIYSLGNKYLDADNFIQLDQIVFTTIDHFEYYKLWKKGKAKIFPKDHIEELLNDNYETYKEIDNWIENKIISKEEISKFLLGYLEKQTPVTDRIIFYRQFNHIKYLLKADELYLERIQQIKNDFYKIILWFLDKESSLDFELLKMKFIYFSPQEQVRVIRKLFSLKTKNEFELTIEKLNELTRIDLDLYKTNLKFNPSIPLDVSTDVIIKALLSYTQKQKFLVESELLSVVLNDLKEDKTRRFKLETYFETCKGRETAEWNWSRNGEIRKIPFGNNQFYFSIEFEYDPNLVEKVKTIPGRKWNGDTKFWGVPSSNETEVLAFAKDNRFFLDFEGSNYANNTHLAEFKRVGKPNGISFCEGRLANKQHEMFRKNFWWCGGQPCFEKCETIHNTEEWENYTLLDFCEILQLNTDETNRLGDFIPKGFYYQFIGLINRFNRLLEKIYCQECNEILHPVETGHFAAHTVVRFCCENSNCGQHKKEVYLNHCLNGQCNGIIDSRVSKKCNNGLFICDSCGSCCSHEMLKRRLNNLQTVGGFIHANLTRCVNEKLGHLERAEYFCYQCGNEMDETSNDIFHCNQCNVTYDTTKYKFKRPHKHLRATNITDTRNDEQDEDMPF
jgi:cold shock CspA family protein